MLGISVQARSAGTLFEISYRRLTTYAKSDHGRVFLLKTVSPAMRESKFAFPGSKLLPPDRMKRMMNHGCYLRFLDQVEKR
jgi:hypothetical protein